MKKPTGAAIKEAVQYWKTVLGMDDWEVTVRIGRMSGGDYGSAEVNIPYRRIELSFFPKGMAEKRETVDGMALHELAHKYGEALAAKALKLCRSEKDREEVEDLEEGLCTDIERLVLRLHKRPRVGGVG